MLDLFLLRIIRYFECSALRSSTIGVIERKNKELDDLIFTLFSFFLYKIHSLIENPHAHRSIFGADLIAPYSL